MYRDTQESMYMYLWNSELSDVNAKIQIYHIRQSMSFYMRTILIDPH